MSVTEVELLDLLTLEFFSDPVRGERLAREAGLWDFIKENVRKPIQLALCRQDINAFIEYCIVDPETGDFAKQKSFHRDWQHKMTTKRRCMIVASRGHGKCEMVGTLFTLSDGRRVPVEDLPIGEEFECLSWDAESGYSWQTARVWQDSIQPCYEILTKAGRTLRYSEGHPIWTAEGWVQASGIKAGSTVGVARNQPHGSIRADVNRAWLLGLLIGDGGLTIQSRIGLTCGDAHLLQSLEGYVTACGFRLVKVSQKRETAQFMIRDGGVPWIKSLGLQGKSSHTKFIPSEVFTWDRSAVENLIAGYFDADGCVSQQAKVVEFSSVSRQLLLDVQSLLLRSGVVSSIRIKNGRYKGEHHLSYRLQINGSSIEPFARIVGTRSEKGVKLAAMLAKQGMCNDNLDLIPDSIFSRLGIGRGCCSDAKDGCAVHTRRPRGTMRRKVQLLAQKQSRRDLFNEADLFWDEVVSVTPLGDQQTYSTEVGTTHVHITDDVVTHNSIQVISRTVWEMGRNANIRVKIVCAKDDKAEEVLGAVKDMIENSVEVREVFPDLIIDADRGNRKGEFYLIRSNNTMRDPSCQAAGVLTAGAGGRADVLVCDDVVDPKNAIVNPGLRDQVKQMLATTWFSLVAASGRIWYLATPYHILDATHHLRDTVGDAWDIWWTPTVQSVPEVDEAGKQIMVDDPEQPGKQIPLVKKVYMWPEKWSQEALDMKLAEIGPQAFTSQFLLRAMSDEDRTFPDDSLRRSFDREIAYIGDGIDPKWPTYGGVDLASALGKRAAWTVIITLARNPENKKLYIKALYRRKMKFPATIKAICAEFDAHKWQKVYVESNQYQTAVSDELGENYAHVPVEAFMTSLNKNDELVGLPGLNNAFHKGLFAIPAARFPLSPDDQSDLGALMTELQTHPGGETKDVIMALWFAYRAAIDGMGGHFEEAYLAALDL